MLAVELTLCGCRFTYHFVSEWIELRHIGDGMKVRKKGDETSVSTRFSRWLKVFAFCFAGKDNTKGRVSPWR